MKYLLLILIFANASAIAQPQQPPSPLYATDTVWGMVKVLIAKQKKDTVIIRDTIALPAPKPDTVCVPYPVEVLIHDTVFLPCKTDTPIIINPVDTIIAKPDTSKKFRYSQFEGSFENFIKAAQATGVEAILDMDIDLKNTVHIKGPAIVKGFNRPTITSTAKNGIWLHEGDHILQGFNLKMLGSTSSGILTQPSANILWNNTLDGINITGGEVGYNSSRGGNPNNKNGTVIRNCAFENIKINISLFSQDGPYKFLHLDSVILKSDTSHNIYAHPNVSLDFYNTISLGAGKLFLHHFSGGGVPGEAEYIKIRKCSTEAALYSPLEFATGSKNVFIDSCKIGLYTTGPWHIAATNTEFVKTGGAPSHFDSSTLVNCSGSIWPFNSTIIGGQFKEVRILPLGSRLSGNNYFSNTQIDYMGGGGINNPFSVAFSNTHITGIGIAFSNLNPMAKLKLLDGSTFKGAYGWKPLPGMVTEFIKQVK